MADSDVQAREQAPRTDTPNRPAAGSNVPPWEFERHLESQHNMLVDAEQGWPTVVKRYRLFRPMEGKRAEKTLLVYEGTGPAALAYFFAYVHPNARASTPVRTTYAKPSTYARRT